MGTTRTVSVRELRNRGGDVLDEVARGSVLIVTRDGAPAAELRPLAPQGISASELIARRRNLPVLDPAALRRDVDAAVDMTL